MRHSHGDRPLPAKVTDFSEDRSPYGVRGLAGNAMDWCLDILDDPQPSDGTRFVLEALLHRIHSDETSYRASRGGSWFGVGEYCRLANRRHSYAPHYRFNNMTVRVAYSLG